MIITQQVFLFLVVSTLAVRIGTPNPDRSQQVNAVIGDVSFVEKYGHQPDPSASETLRIQTHLEFVENLLRQRDRGDLTPELQQRREMIIDLLGNYRLAGRFPRNHEYRDRRVPCLIDADGQICAVGYLIEQTAGRGVAEAINKKYQYSEILGMNDESVDNWIAWSGLTKEECAWIQPTYREDEANHIEQWYAIYSTILTGTNLSFSAMNTVQMTQERRGKILPALGLLTGSAQMVLGIVQFPPEQGDGYRGEANESQKIISMINIGVGTATMILSVWNLATIPSSEKISLNIHPLAIPSGDAGVGVTLRARL